MNESDCKRIEAICQRCDDLQLVLLSGGPIEEIAMTVDVYSAALRVLHNVLYPLMLLGTKRKFKDRLVWINYLKSTWGGTGGKGAQIQYPHKLISGMEELHKELLVFKQQAGLGIDVEFRLSERKRAGKLIEGG